MPPAYSANSLKRWPAIPDRVLGLEITPHRGQRFWHRTWLDTGARRLVCRISRVCWDGTVLFRPVYGATFLGHGGRPSALRLRIRPGTLRATVHAWVPGT